ncbi:MAG: formimidoylglutamate deiminase [Burkholderiaceae bacterium]
MPEQHLWTERAWIEGGWKASVLLSVDEQGRWAGIHAGVATPPAGTRILPGPVLPGMVDAHSHAFQRAFAGLSERRESDADDFWSWRDRMYRVALRITSEQMQAVAAHLYVELLRGGYTQVCEFHYLHHDPQGTAYADPCTMSWALADAAEQAGLGLTLLPVLYERAGFAQPALRDDQRRFASTPTLVHAIHNAASRARRPLLNAGVAIHSLRAASADSIRALLRHVGNAPMPIHIHVAEQTQEVTDCLQATGKRPIAWLCSQLPLDARWQLVHATHAEPKEIAAVADCGAGIVICPSTEGNLGDGLTDLPGWLSHGVPMAIGSDSQVTRNWPEELRWLEYGQRLLCRQRNVAASPSCQPATAARLFEAALSGGGAAAGQTRWGLVSGARADALVLDAKTPALLGLPASHQLDALVFAAAEPAFAEVLVAGNVVMRHGRHAQEQRIATEFESAMQALWADQV